jgi:hypothetical protein
MIAVVLTILAFAIFSRGIAELLGSVLPKTGTGLLGLLVGVPMVVLAGFVLDLLSG